MKRTLAALMLVSTLAGTPAAVSGENLGTDRQRAACTMDVFRLCAAYIPNVSNIVMCLRAQTPNLSPACRVVFEDEIPPPTR